MFLFPQETPDLSEAKKPKPQTAKKPELQCPQLCLWKIFANKCKASFYMLAVFYVVMILMHIFLIMDYFHLMS